MTTKSRAKPIRYVMKRKKLTARHVVSAALIAFFTGVIIGAAVTELVNRHNDLVWQNDSEWLRISDIQKDPGD